MKCDELRASRIYDSLMGHLLAPPERHEEFIAAMGAGQEVFEFESGFGMKFRFINRDGVWVVGFDQDEFWANYQNSTV